MLDKLKLKLARVKDWTANYFKKDPVKATTVFVGLATGVLKMVTAYNKWSNSRTWKREVARREAKLKLESRN